MLGSAAFTLAMSARAPSSLAEVGRMVVAKRSLAKGSLPQSSPTTIEPNPNLTTVFLVNVVDPSWIWLINAFLLPFLFFSRHL